jgi:hypothetical protein
MNNVIEVVGLVGIFRILIYSIGDPHSDEFNPKAVFAGYSSFIAGLRAKYIGLIAPSYYGERNLKFQKLERTYLHRSGIVGEVLPYAGVLQMLGFCSTCTSVWFFGFTVLYQFQDVYLYGLALLLSRFTFKYL